VRGGRSRPEHQEDDDSRRHQADRNAGAERRRCKLEDDRVVTGRHHDALKHDVGALHVGRLAIDRRAPAWIVCLAEHEVPALRRGHIDRHARVLDGREV